MESVDKITPESNEHTAQGESSDKGFKEVGAESHSFDPNSDNTQNAGQSHQPSGQGGQNFQFLQNVVMDPATGQLYITVPDQNGQVQYVRYIPQVENTGPETVRQPDFTQIVKKVEDFAEGDATVADVVKTLYTETAQDDQFWKGAIVGAAATVLLTNDSVKSAMGKTFGSFFGGKKQSANVSSESAESEKK